MKILDALESNAQRIAQLVQAAPRLCYDRPVGDIESMAAQLSHLADLESRTMHDYIRTIALSPNPVLTRPESRAERSDSSALKALHAFVDARYRNTAFVRLQGESALARTGRMEDGRTVTLRDILERLAAHDCEHISELCKLLEAYQAAL